MDHVHQHHRRSQWIPMWIPLIAIALITPAYSEPYIDKTTLFDTAISARPDLANVFIPVELSPLPQEASATVAFGIRVHVVEDGESLYTIAEDYQTDLKTILAANGFASKTVIHPGDRLLVAKVPGVIHRVSSGDTLDTIAKDYGSTSYKIEVTNQLADPNKLCLGQTLVIPDVEKRLTGVDFRWPFSAQVKSHISSGYGPRQHPLGGNRHFHTGIDLAATYGTAILAAESGRVTHSGRKGYYGNCVVIEHDDGYSTLYGHASRLYVKQGQYVARGQSIAAVGSTGRSTGPHLHFEVLRNGKTTNPINYLPPTKK